MNHNRTAAGHLAAFVTILIWGTTFISTKVLLRTFSPVEILFIRFVMGYLALWLVCPRSLRLTSARQEGLYAAAGFCGVTMYYLLENILYPGIQRGRHHLHCTFLYCHLGLDVPGRRETTLPVLCRISAGHGRHQPD